MLCPSSLARGTLLLLLFLPSLPGCGNVEAARPTTSSSERLQPISPAPPASFAEPEEQRVKVFWAGADGELRLDGEESQRLLPALKRGQTIEDQFQPQGNGRASLRIEGPFAPGSFDRIVLSLVGAANNNDSSSFRVSLLVGRKVVAEHELRKRIRKSCTLTFDFPIYRSMTVPIDAIEVSVPRRWIRSFHLVALALSKRALLGGWLPHPGAEPDLVFVRDEYRRCRTLAKGHELRYELVVPPGARLGSSIGLPLSVAWLTRRARVVAQVRPPAGDPYQESWELQDARPWRPIEVDLTRWEGQRIELTLSLETNLEEAALLLEDPLLVLPGPKPARVLLVTSDTHRGDHMGYASNRARTPFLDELARRGASFLDCYASAQTTSPSHASLMTGLSPLENGVLANGYVLDEGARTLAEQFQAAGYQTWAAVSAVHLAPPISGLGQGFDRFTAPSEGQRDSAETWSELEAWLDDAPDAPLFVWLHIFDAHGPYDPPEAYRADIWEGGDPRDEDLPPLGENHEVPWDRSLRSAEYIEALYRAEVSYVDDRLRTVMAHPEFEEALLALTADHGEVLKSRQDRVWFEHAAMLLDTLQVPLLLHGPGVSTLRSEDGVQQIDLGRTLLDLAGIGQAAFPGRNLFAPSVPEPRFGLGNFCRVASVRLGRWHLNLRLQPDSITAGVEPVIVHEVELFDVSADPASLRDLAEVEVDVCVRLREMLLEWLTTGAQERLVGNSQLDDEALVAELESLGYAQGAGAPTSDLWNPDCVCEPCSRFRELEKRTSR